MLIVIYSHSELMLKGNIQKKCCKFILKTIFFSFFQNDQNLQKSFKFGLLPFSPWNLQQMCFCFVFSNLYFNLCFNSLSPYTNKCFGPELLPLTNYFTLFLYRMKFVINSRYLASTQYEYVWISCDLSAQRQHSKFEYLDVFESKI